MLFSIPTAALKYSDVVNFLRQEFREGVGLDYKRDFPAGLEKTICAMANSYGGTIVIGAGEEASGKPDPESKGIISAKGLEERVTRIAVDNIFPPIVPEVAVCQEGDQCFVVVRVPLGKDTPYTVRRNQIYVRTGNVNSPDDLATPERIEWLLDGRRKAAELRKRTLLSMASRAQNRGRIQEVEIPFGIVSMSFGPIHPYETLFADQDMPNLREQIQVSAYGMEFPAGGARPRTVQGGISYFEHFKTSNDFSYFEINRFGYLYFLQDMGLQRFEKNQAGDLELKERKFESFRILRAVDIFLSCARRMFLLKRHEGPLRLTVQADKLFNIPMHPFPREWMLGVEPQPSVDDQLLWFQDWSPSELETYKVKIEKLVELGQEISFALGFPHEGKAIRGMLERNSLKY